MVTLWLIMMVSGVWWLQIGEWLDLGLSKKHREGAMTVVCGCGKMASNEAQWLMAKGMGASASNGFVCETLTKCLSGVVHLMCSV